MATNQQQNQDVKIPQQLIKGYDTTLSPVKQINSNIIDPTPGIICTLGFFIFIIVVYKKIEDKYNKWFEHRKEMDELELKLKYKKDLL